jgi:ketosteroid isomerase-like protein
MNRQFLSIVWLAAAAFGLAACERTAGGDAAAAADEIKRSSREMAPAFNTGDIDTIVAKFAADAVMMPQGSKAVSGIEEIRKLWTDASAANREDGISVLLRDDDSARVAGDVGWHAGAFVFRDAAGQELPGGHYVEAWENRDGKWVIVRFIWNEDHVAPAPAAPAEEPAAEPPVAQ